MDGAEETCNPDAFMQAFPKLSCVIMNDKSFFGGLRKLADAASKQIGDADVCLVDSWELFAFTPNAGLFEKILSGAKECLPDNP